MKGARTAVSLADELRALVGSAEGVLLLLDGGTFEIIEADPIAAAKAMVAVLASRLRQVEKAVRGSIDPGVLRSAHNATDAEPLHHEDPDVRLVPFSPGRRK